MGLFGHKTDPAFLSAVAPLAGSAAGVGSLGAFPPQTMSFLLLVLGPRSSVCCPPQRELLCPVVSLLGAGREDPFGANGTGRAHAAINCKAPRRRAVVL